MDINNPDITISPPDALQPVYTLTPNQIIGEVKEKIVELAGLLFNQRIRIKLPPEYFS